MDTAAAALRPLTIDDLPNDEVGPRHELIEGSLYVMPLAGLEHQGLVKAIERELDRTAGPDVIVLPGANIISDRSTLVSPDVVVITQAPFARGGLGVPPADVVLVVEIESPSTRRRDRTLKTALYAEWAVPGYLADPEARTITAFGQPPLPLAEEAIFPR